MTAQDLDHYYELLGELARRTGGPRRLCDCTSRSGWPQRGVYFFFEAGENRSNGSPRVVRIGTHALKAGSQTSLWNRLSQHRGSVGGRNAGGGNHRGSIFRLHVGACLIARDGAVGDRVAATWGRRSSADAATRAVEAAHERRVSAYIGAMPFLWLGVDDEPGPGNDRALIEAGSIALLSGLANVGADLPSASWLGRFSSRPAIVGSGLWNVNHVSGPQVPEFMPALERWISYC